MISAAIAQIDEEIGILIVAALDKLEPLDQSMATRSLMMNFAAS